MLLPACAQLVDWRMSCWKDVRKQLFEIRRTVWKQLVLLKSCWKEPRGKQAISWLFEIRMTVSKQLGLSVNAVLFWKEAISWLFEIRVSKQLVVYLR